MSRTSIKNLAFRDGKKEQSNVELLNRQRPENITRNKVMWQKNILPGGRADWVIVGFSAPVLIEKKIEAQVDARGIFAERNQKDSGDLISAAVPIELTSKVENAVLDLLAGNEYSREMGGNTVVKTDAITMKVDTKEVIKLSTPLSDHPSFGPPKILPHFKHYLTTSSLINQQLHIQLI